MPSHTANSLGAEVIGRQAGIVNLQEDIGIVHGGREDLQDGENKAVAQKAPVQFHCNLPKPRLPYSGTSPSHRLLALTHGLLTTAGQRGTEHPDPCSVIHLLHNPRQGLGRQVQWPEVP